MIQHLTITLPKDSFITNDIPTVDKRFSELRKSVHTDYPNSILAFDVSSVSSLATVIVTLPGDFEEVDKGEFIDIGVTPQIRVSKRVTEKIILWATPVIVLSKTRSFINSVVEWTKGFFT